MEPIGQHRTRTGKLIGFLPPAIRATEDGTLYQFPGDLMVFKDAGLQPGDVCRVTFELQENDTGKLVKRPARVGGVGFVNLGVGI